MADAPAQSVMEQIVSLCKRRGFIFPSSEIYGGLNGFWDYGPLGVELKSNIRDWWWRNMVSRRPSAPTAPVDMVGLDSLDHQEPQGLGRRGHVGGFSDPMVDCRATKERYPRRPALRAASSKVKRKDGRIEDSASSPSLVRGRRAGRPREGRRQAGPRAPAGAGAAARAEQLVPYTVPRRDGRSEKVHRPRRRRSRGTLTEPRAFNLMFETYVGAIQDESNKAYLRPETAQGIFLNFKNVVDTTRVKVPFGIAQVGKSFRNEINPRNFTFRSREFEQMEIECFCHPDEARKWYEFWHAERMRWWRVAGHRARATCASASTSRTSWRTTPTSRRPTSNTGSRSPRPTSASSKASPTAATTT